MTAAAISLHLSCLILIVFFTLLSTCSTAKWIQLEIESPKNSDFYPLPRFWTNVGFCPFGEISNDVITKSLLSEDVETNLRFIGALPNGAISSIRIHWLLELIDFVKFENHGIPVYNFTQLDRFIARVNEADLALGFEMMGTPREVFTFHNITRSFIWEDLVYQIVYRYLGRYGVDEIKKWKFETWNEPDLKTYNKLDFNVTEFLSYIDSVRRGLNAAARSSQDLHLQLRGPAGLFKNQQKHPLCWSILDKCAKDNENCPLDILTFHRKGQGDARGVVTGTQTLLKDLEQRYPNINEMKISNDEADPIAGWSTPYSFRSDVRYAIILATIIVKYWNAILNQKEFKNFESISHDNAFLSYHPYEFEQRTLLARFQMNQTNPPYSQFIQKPVYAVLGMFGNLGKFARDIDNIPEENATLLATAGHPDAPLYLAYVLYKEHDGIRSNFIIEFNLKNFQRKDDEYLSYIIEAIETDSTDPVKIWNFYGKPSYPNVTVCEEMRRSQGPKMLTTKIIKPIKDTFQISLSLRTPWIILFRLCSSEVNVPFRPHSLRLKRITHGEILLTWKEIHRPDRCIKTYEVFFSKYSKEEWILISKDWHIPFWLFHFQPKDGIIEGSYKVRAIDIFSRESRFSKIQKNLK